MSSIQKRKQNVNNYRPITLLIIAYNIFAILLDKRLSDSVEKKNCKNVKWAFTQTDTQLTIYS
jgi:hypothetical protein